jgi:hypothetical protein
MTLTAWNHVHKETDTITEKTIYYILFPEVSGLQYKA